MRVLKSIVATRAPAGTSDGVSATYRLQTQDGFPLFDPQNVVISALYVSGVLISPKDYTNNSGSENGTFPSGTITFGSGFIPGQGSELTWSGTADDFEYTLAPALLSQYANSPALLAFMEYMNQWIDPAADLDLFYNNIWNIQTAVGVGLDIWGRIVGAPRTLQLSNTQNYFGFKEGSPSFYPFNNEPFYAGKVQGQLYTLSDASYRVYILTKAFANICSYSIPSMNALLNFMFAGRGSCYVQETSTPLTMQYVFNFPLTTWEESIILQPGLLPRPAGVGVTVVVN